MKTNQLTTDSLFKGTAIALGIIIISAFLGFPLIKQTTIIQTK